MEKYFYKKSENCNGDEKIFYKNFEKSICI